MLQKLKHLSRNAKIGIGAGAAALVILAAALAVWQPWNQTAPPDSGENPGQDQIQPPENGQDSQETPATLRVGGEDVPCVLYQRDGWSLYIPDTWVEEAAGRFVSPEGAAVSVLRVKNGAEPVTDGTYAALFADGENLCREFYTGDGKNCWRVTCSAPAADWAAYDALFRAIGRTGGLDGAVPFDAWSPMPSEPDWETLQGDTVLFMDKDGEILSDDAEAAVRAWMLALPAEEKAFLNGQYDFSMAWCADYVGLAERQYTDVFRVDVSFGVKDGAEEGLSLEGGREIRDGRLYEGKTLYLTAVHDGSRIDRLETLWTAAAPADAGFTRTLAGQDQAAEIDLAAVYQGILDAQPEDAETPVLFEESNSELIDNFYPGLLEISMKQQKVYMPPVATAPCEIVLVEVADAKDVEAVREIFQARIEQGAANTSYPESADVWRANAQIQVSGSFVCMIVLPDGNVIPEDVFALA